MNGIIKRWVQAGLLLACLAPALPRAATLYEWVDKAGETHYGYRPPPGVVGTIVGEKLRNPQPPENPINCRDLQEQHLQLIDKEIARLRKLPVGVGPEFEFTAEARQKFINDLLAHRAALLTGRRAEDFSSLDQKREMGDLKEKYKQERAKLQENLENQAQQIKEQRMELERQRRFNRIIQPYPYYPGMPY